MTGSTVELSLPVRRTYSERSNSSARGKKLRVIQLASYPDQNRGARANLFTIHERLLARGHESFVIDLNRFSHFKKPGVFFPRSAMQLARLLMDLPSDIVHMQIGSALTAGKLALAAAVNRLPNTKTICTLHLGGHFYPRKGLRASRWGVTAAILRQFDSLIAVNPETASFFEHIGAKARQVHLITPFPRLRVSETVTLNDEIETFCRQHTPLIVSVGEFDEGSNLGAQFEMLSRVRERYPSAGLIAIGDGELQFKYLYERALHQDCNHIELTGTLSPAATGELIRRASVFLRTGNSDADSFAVHEAVKSGTPMVAEGGSQIPGLGEVEATVLQVLRTLQVVRPQYEDAHTALSDGSDDVIRLYKQMASTTEEPALPLTAAYEWPSISWDL